MKNFKWWKKPTPKNFKLQDLFNNEDRPQLTEILSHASNIRYESEWTNPDHVNMDMYLTCLEGVYLEQFRNHCTDSNAFPFYYFPKLKHIIYGHFGNYHSDIIAVGKENTELMSNINEIEHIEGRAFLYNNSKIMIISFWDYPEHDEIMWIVNDIKKTHAINPNLILWVENSQIADITKDSSNYNMKKVDMSNDYLLHLMSADKKWDKLKAFRDTRNKKIADKLTYTDREGNKREIPMAQYNFLRRVDENKLNGIVGKIIRKMHN